MLLVHQQHVLLVHQQHVLRVHQQHMLLVHQQHMLLVDAHLLNEESHWPIQERQFAQGPSNGERTRTMTPDLNIQKG